MSKAGSQWQTVLLAVTIQYLKAFVTQLNNVWHYVIGPLFAPAWCCSTTCILWGYSVFHKFRMSKYNIVWHVIFLVSKFSRFLVVDQKPQKFPPMKFYNMCMYICLLYWCMVQRALSSWPLARMDQQRCHSCVGTTNPHQYWLPIRLCRCDASYTRFKRITLHCSASFLTFDHIASQLIWAVTGHAVDWLHVCNHCTACAVPGWPTGQISVLQLECTPPNIKPEN